MNDHIFTVLKIKHMVNQDGELTIPQNWQIVLNLHYKKHMFVFCPCLVQKATAYNDTNPLNVCCHSQKGFCGIFVGILQNQKGYLVYVPSTQKLFSSHDIVFDETFLSEFTYMSRPYSEALTM